jgi:hypothetical protein
VRNFLWRFGWAIVLVIVGAFIWFTIEISKPVEGSLQEDLVSGTLHAAAELAPEGPFLEYIALYAGDPARELPEHPLIDQLAEDDGSFSFPADPIDGTRFFLLARIETAQERFFCKRVALPPMRVDEDEQWVVAATGEPLEPQRIVVDKSQPCSF